MTLANAGAMPHDHSEIMRHHEGFDFVPENRSLSASDYVLIPVQADYLAAEDMTELVGAVQNIRRQINPKLKIGGVFLKIANETDFRKDIIHSHGKKWSWQIFENRHFSPGRFLTYRS